MLSRRELLWWGAGTATAAAGWFLDAPIAQADPLGWPIGFQGYDARFLLIENWDKGWETMKNIGFKSVDLVSFKGYGYEKSALANMPAKQIRDKLDEVGMAADNCQYYYSELHEQFDEKMEFSKALRIKNVICAPSLDHIKTIDGWKWHADQFNMLGEKVKKAGFQLGYHNHDIEFVDIDGQTPYDVLMAGCDKNLVRFQIDVGNLTFGGKDAITYLKKYPDRYFSMHAKDFAPGKASVPVGQGILNWPEIFKVVKTTKIENYFAEVAAYSAGSLQKLTPWPTDSTDQLRQSYEYLHKLTV